MEQAAELLGLHQSNISRIESGKQRPDWPTMEKYRIASEGAVTPNDFLPDAQEEAA